MIVLDEATANVDMKTDEFIQQKIKEKFTDCTILTIAHRLNTIADYDKVIVMDKGTVAEFDKPFALLCHDVNEDKEVSQDRGLFAKMVSHTGEQNSEKIFLIAKEKFFEKKN